MSDSDFTTGRPHRPIIRCAGTWHVERKDDSGETWNRCATVEADEQGIRVSVVSSGGRLTNDDAERLADLLYQVAEHRRADEANRS